MSDVAKVTKAGEGRKPGRGWMILVGFVAVDFVLGAVAGIYASGYFATPPAATEVAPDAATDHGHAADTAATTPEGARQEVEVGRITVVLPSDGPKGGSIHMMITPLVVGHPVAAGAGTHGEAEGDSAPGPTAELRDAFIEYLSQLHETEVHGSIGLAMIRAELLRRARAVAPDLNASAVLIQEFLIQ
jgi:flagellar FliL protein